jgi:hypothetical protein
MLKSMATFNLEEMVMRMDVLGGKTGDPFDTFEYIRDIETKHRFCSLFFFLSGNKGRYDVNYSLHTEQFKTLIHQMKQDRTLGIHPSYRSNHNRKDRAREFDRFASLLGNQPVISRQHYLFLRFPSTYMQLIESGIREDYSMGYASYPGFRAGTCTPFRFYDLLRETETSLVVHPFPVMDVTLRKYLQLTPNEAIDRILILADRVREVNGRFVSLWHNESLSEYGMWKGWRRVFEEMAGKLTTDPGVQA